MIKSQLCFCLWLRNWYLFYCCRLLLIGINVNYSMLKRNIYEINPNEIWRRSGLSKAFTVMLDNQNKKFCLKTVDGLGSRLPTHLRQSVCKEWAFFSSMSALQKVRFQKNILCDWLPTQICKYTFIGTSNQWYIFSNWGAVFSTSIWLTVETHFPR